MRRVYIDFGGCIQMQIFYEEFGRFFNLATASRLEMRSNVDPPVHCFGRTIEVAIRFFDALNLLNQFTQ